MKICSTDCILESINESKFENESLRPSRMSGEMMRIADEVEQELEDEFMDECDESNREAA
jgi:hypothetical protein